MGYRVAVVGATGNVGREIFNILAERQFPLDDVAALASSRSTGDLIDFGDSGEELKVKNLDISTSAAGTSRCSPQARTSRRSMRRKPPRRAAPLSTTARCSGWTRTSR